MFSKDRIVLISRFAGKLEEILNAYIGNRLDDPCFVMPGEGRPKGRPEKEGRSR